MTMDNNSAANRQNVYKGTLVYHNKDVPVKVAYSSRFTMLISFIQESQTVNETFFEKSKSILNTQSDSRYGFVSDTLFDSLTIEINDKVFKFGRCRFIRDKENRLFNGKLYFTEDVYDIYEIFSANRLISLKDHFRNISVILPQKTRIDQRFRDYTSNLAFDLNVYKGLFDDLDKKYVGESQMIYDVVQDIIIEKEGKAFKSFFDEKLDELAGIVGAFSPPEHAVHGYYFRKLMWDIILTSEFMRRTNLKPRNYPGDSEMMNMIYENAYQGDSTFSKIMHKHPLEAKASQAVRNRVKIIANVISDIKSSQEHTEGVFKILSLACGPAREIENIVRNKVHCGEYHFTLFDQDIKAIEDAKRNISKVEQRVDEKLNYAFIKDSIRTIISVPDLSEKWGTFHFIYALGLFDYLTERVAQAIVPKLYKLLKPGGQILLGNFHVENPNRYYMAYWLDWSLYYRNEEEMLNLTKNLPPVEKNIFFDESRSQMFLTITKT